MGLNIVLYGIKEKDAKFEAMLSIYEKCVEYDISLPEEVWNYFNGRMDKEGVSIHISDTKYLINSSPNYRGNDYYVDLKRVLADHPDIRYIKVNYDY